jgi:hypothetical protein
MIFNRKFFRFSKPEKKEALTLGLGLNVFLLLSMLYFPAISVWVNPLIKIAVALVGVAILVVFIRSGTESRSQIDWPLVRYSALISILLAALTYCVFYRPMLENFWVGYDEPVLLSIKNVWFDTYDQCCGRPLAGFESFLGNVFMPGNIYSLPITLAVERWFLAVFVFLSMLSILPNARNFVFAAGILVVVNPTETLRFVPGLSTPYLGALIFLFFAYVVFVFSYKRSSRTLLICSCALLWISFFHYETILPIAALAPFTLFLLPQKPELRLWMLAWCLTMANAAIRFLIILLAFRPYQSNYTKGFWSSFDNIPLLFNPIFKFISPIFSTPFAIVPVLAGIATLVSIFLFAQFYRSPESEATTRKQMAICTLIALAGVFFAILPEITVPNFTRLSPNYDGDLTSRLENTPGPFQSIAWAAAIAYLASFLSRANLFFAGGIALLVTASTMNSWETKSKPALNQHMSFQIESNIFRAAAPAILQSPADAVIFFAIPDDKPSPLGFGYHPFHMSCLLFGRPAYAGHLSPALGLKSRATAFPSSLEEKGNYYDLPVTKNLIAFSINNEGGVSQIQNVADLLKSHVQKNSQPNAVSKCSLEIAGRKANGDLPFLFPSN